MGRVFSLIYRAALHCRTMNDWRRWYFTILCRTNTVTIRHVCVCVCVVCVQEHAFESSQKYKEGKYIIEVAHMIKDNGWDWTAGHIIHRLFLIVDRSIDPPASIIDRVRSVTRVIRCSSLFNRSHHHHRQPSLHYLLLLLLLLLFRQKLQFSTIFNIMVII